MQSNIYAGKDFTLRGSGGRRKRGGVTYYSSVYTVKVHVADKGTGTEVTKKITRQPEKRQN